MAQPISMPKLGQSEEEGKLVRWIKKEGDIVSKGDVLFEIETDKALLEVESFYQGTLLRTLVAEGQTVPVQTIVGFIGEPGEPIPDVAIVRSGKETHEAGAQTQASFPAPPRRIGVSARSHEERPAIEELTRAEQRPSTSPVVVETPAVLRISPRAAKLAKEAVIDPTPIVGTGPSGRILERDVIAYMKVKGYNHLAITPAAKQLAALEQIDILSLRNPAEGGRIGVAAVRRAIAEKPKPMSRMRQVIAARLTQSFTSAPHFFVTVAVDMTDLVRFRSELKSQGSSYTLTDFISMAVVLSLKEFPIVNSTTDGNNVRWHSKVHLGLAVSLDQGLVVPVIRDADDLTLAEIHERASELITKARAGRLTPDAMTGSTFTVSNLGMLNVENFTAIINPGESAILAVSSIRKQPVVKDERIVTRELMNLTLSSDHRIIDGALAAAFANAIKSKLEEIPLWRGLA